MKKHINWNDFISLSFKEVSILQKLLEIEYHTIKNKKHWEEVRNHTQIIDNKVINIHTSYIGFIKKCNIENMFEILAEDFDYLERCYKGFWLYLYDTPNSIQFEAENICDVAFKAVRYKLKEVK